MGRYNKTIEEDMVYVYSLMDEKSQRHYAAIEALKIGYGGISYIAGLFGISEKTVSRGIDEIKKGMASPQEV
jgi:hypothetical protein